MNWKAMKSGKNVLDTNDPYSKIDCEYWIKEIDTGEVHITRFGNTHHILEYELYDTNLNRFFFETSGWSIVRLRDVSGKCAYWGPVLVTIKDPFSVERETYYSPSPEWLGICDSINNFVAIAKFDSWRMYDLNKKFIELEDAKEKVERENNTLKNKISSFEETKLFQDISSTFTLNKKNGTIRSDHMNELIINNRISDSFYNLWIK